MKIRFQADADLDRTIITALLRLEPRIDFQTAHEAGLKGLPDHEVLALAARDGRVLVSHDQSTMPYHFAEFIQENESAGVFIIPQGWPYFIAAEELLLMWAASEAEEWVNCICHLPL